MSYSLKSFLLLTNYTTKFSHFIWRECRNLDVDGNASLDKMVCPQTVTVYVSIRMLNGTTCLKSCVWKLQKKVHFTIVVKHSDVQDLSNIRWCEPQYRAELQEISIMNGNKLMEVNFNLKAAII